MRKPVFGVSDQVGHKPDCAATEDGFGFRKKRDCTICVAKTKALIRCAVTTQLICGFVLTYAKSQFSHNEAQIMYALVTGWFAPKPVPPGTIRSKLIFRMGRFTPGRFAPFEKNA